MAASANKFEFRSVEFRIRKFDLEESVSKVEAFDELRQSELSFGHHLDSYDRLNGEAPFRDLGYLNFEF